MYWGISFDVCGGLCTHLFFVLWRMRWIWYCINTIRTPIILLLIISVKHQVNLVTAHNLFWMHHKYNINFRCVPSYFDNIFSAIVIWETLIGITNHSEWSALITFIYYSWKCVIYQKYFIHIFSLFCCQYCYVFHL